MLRMLDIRLTQRCRTQFRAHIKGSFVFTFADVSTSSVRVKHMSVVDFSRAKVLGKHVPCNHVQS